MEVKVALFDADGVLAIPEEFFSRMYARSHGLAEESFNKFFVDEFPAALLGKADLKELISQNQDIWHWKSNIDDLLKQWFESENIINKPLLDLISKTRADGLPCYLATNQEKYRGQYIREVMFKDIFNDYFISSDLGVKKPDLEFFSLVLDKIKHDIPEIEAGNILFIDDTESHIEGAKQLGFSAHLYQSVEHVAELLKQVQ